LQTVFKFLISFSLILGGFSGVGNGQDWALPTLPSPEEGDTRLSSSDQIQVKTFKFEGNTVFTERELLKLVRNYQHRSISAEELQEVKRLVTKHYIDQGYINSGVVIPDQEIKKGIIRLQIIEGHITSIEIKGNTWLSTSYILARIKLEIGSLEDRVPLNIVTLQERLKLIKLDPRIDNVNALVAPGLALGEAILKVQIEEAGKFYGKITVNNHIAPKLL